MQLKVTKSTLSGEINVPASKSHTIRALAVALMANGVSKIHNPLYSGDTISCLNAIKNLGATVNKLDNCWEITGNGGNFAQLAEKIDLGNSGTSLRILSGLASTGSEPVSFDGDHSLRSRPMGAVLNALENLGADIKSKDGKCPITITGPVLGGETDVNGKSSQFLTSLLFATPLAKNNSIIKVDDLHEKPYVEITLDWLRRQNIKFANCADLSRFEVEGNQKYTPFEWSIPADFSTATFPLIAAAVTQGEIAINNLDFNDRQGDKEVFNILENMGLSITKKDKTTIAKYAKPLVGKIIDLNNTPDALPALAVVACFAKGETQLVNVAQARIKETDRIKCMTAELKKMGADITELDDGMIIKESKLHGTTVEGYDDHRIIMALAIAGLGASGQTIINAAESVGVTYPNFVDDFQKLKAEIKEV